jgi:hypothetical protein
LGRAWTRPGFAVERAYQVKGALEGSWVAMYFDDKGRIYASSEGKQVGYRGCYQGFRVALMPVQFQ